MKPVLGAPLAVPLRPYPHLVFRFQLPRPAHSLPSFFLQQGMGAMYRGMLPTLLGILPYAGLAFFTFQSLKQVQWGRPCGRAFSGVVRPRGSVFSWLVLPMRWLM